uniref:Cysteine-rich receptor-like protein kinase 6 isoform X2 n=1 Tax=Cicer arietinum TaxID=3827 RepID=A0A3Q7XCL4_CICAR|nr:cysteine-rich receptor-like protein kinase 6 isoform X2 [Cicer arietinum]
MLSNITISMTNFQNILYLFTLVIFFKTFASTNSWDDPFFIYQYCSSNRTTSNTSFQLNLHTLLSSLSSKATTNTNTKFYNTTFIGNNPFDTIYGMFMCRGDVPSQLCQQCIVNATQRLSLQCSLSKEGVVWYEECMAWYSTTFIFSTMATTTPNIYLLNTDKVSNIKNFMSLLFSTMNKTANEASFGDTKFASNENTISKFQTLYCLAQCTPNLSPHDCRTCLSGLIDELPICCEGRIGGRVLNPSCNIRYEFYPFYLSTIDSSKPISQILFPQTKNSSDDSMFLEHPFYLSHNCSFSNKTITFNNTFKVHLTTLLSYLSSNATKSLFYKVDVANKVFGLFMCRGDVAFPLCEQCVQNATYQIKSKCHSFQEAIIWYSHCMIRYSYWNFFSIVDKSHVFYEMNVTSDSSPNKERNLFNFEISNALSKVAIMARDSGERFGTKSIKLNDLQTLYTLGQCTKDLTSDDCKGCLGDIMGNGIAWPYLGSVGGRVLYPSCNLRFELFQFYKENDKASKPIINHSTSGKRRNWSRTIILIVVLTLVLVILFFVGCYLLKRQARRNFKTILGENCAALEPLQFHLALIEASTNNFSNENYIGKGGFGEVYKGILLDGRQIAVKRLSKSSMQGADEFKNEVLLIAKLQHRNLVAFIGFCLEEQEKILIYEYVPNKSLDHFLFGKQGPMFLSWFQRYNIIRGIAQGILYLHEHSRLKVIHRDLKPSNILLDENMIPKISDFGLARIVELNQDKENTNRIVGTLGYMSPEYAMFGQFSDKSDVYSFGVMVLEIITAKKNVCSYESTIGDSLLKYVWRQWRDQIPLSILDPNIKERFSEIEIIKCIQIGLLCVQQLPETRPSMATIVSYLNNDFIELPTPKESAFFFHGQMDAIAIQQDSSSSHYINNTTTCSINDLSMSQFLPR